MDFAFTIKDLGLLKYLGIEVSRTSAGIMLNQRKYILDMLPSAHMDNCHSASFPLPKGLKLNPDEADLLSDLEVFRRIVGKLLYLNLTRPDISYATQPLNQFLSALRTTHFSAAVHVLKYLKGTLNYVLFYASNTPMVLKAYCM